MIDAVAIDAMAREGAGRRLPEAEPMADPATDAAPRPAPPLRRRRPGWVARLPRTLLRLALLAAVPAVAAWFGLGYWIEAGRFVTTDNAYIRADKVAVAPEVKGRVTEVPVSTNDEVAWGDVLFRIDDEPFRIALEEAEAQLAMVRTEIAVLRAGFARKREQLALAQAEARYSATEFDRQAALAERGVIPEARIDEARHALATARRAAAVAERELGEVLAQLGGDPDLPDERFARYNDARARRDRMALALANTVVRAPADAIVARVPIRPGSFVEAGETAIGLVETAGVWLEANLKESDLTYLEVGQAATVEIDAYPDRLWDARVTSFSPATGAEFSLLPPQNATGNWVKVIQRVPVRFRIAERPGDPPLRVGMSATVAIDTGRERPLPAFAADALAWFERATEGALTGP